VVLSVQERLHARADGEHQCPADRGDHGGPAQAGIGAPLTSASVQHLVTVFELVQVMVRAWPDGGCPICCYVDCEVLDVDDDLPDEPHLGHPTVTTA
jgi:hypothetical protein